MGPKLKFVVGIAVGLILGLAVRTIAAFFPQTSVYVTSPAVPAIVGPVTIQPSASSAIALSSCASALPVGGLSCKRSKGNIYKYLVTSSITPAWFVILDASQLPAQGSTITPKKCVYVPANTSLGDTWQNPISFINGLVLGFTTQGCFTYQPSNTAFLSADYM